MKEQQILTLRPYTWVTFIGVILVLIGIYASARTIINFGIFDKYPTEGVLTFNFTGTPPYFQREEDCLYPTTYFTPDGKPRPATKEEKESEKVQQKNCVEGVKESRKKAKVNDVSQSLLFLLLGGGVLVSRRIFFS